jgi:hypothetical protein
MALKKDLEMSIGCIKRKYQDGFQDLKKARGRVKPSKFIFTAICPQQQITEHKPKW